MPRKYDSSKYMVCKKASQKPVQMMANGKLGHLQAKSQPQTKQHSTTHSKNNQEQSLAYLSVWKLKHMSI